MLFLTYAEIHNRKDMQRNFHFLHHTAVFSGILSDSDAPYFLLVSVNGKRFVKMSIYPLREDVVIKLIIEGEAITEAVLETISKFGTQMDIVHSSGLTFTNNHMIYEMYVAKTKTTQQFEEIRQDMMALPTVDNVSLEEITPTHPSKAD